MIMSQCVLVFKCPIEMLTGVCRHAPRPKCSISITDGDYRPHYKTTINDQSQRLTDKPLTPMLNSIFRPLKVALGSFLARSRRC